MLRDFGLAEDLRSGGALRDTGQSYYQIILTIRNHTVQTVRRKVVKNISKHAFCDSHPDAKMRSFSKDLFYFGLLEFGALGVQKPLGPKVAQGIYTLPECFR